MKNIKLFEQYHKLNELYVHKDDNTKYSDMSEKYVVMYKGHVWIFNDDEWYNNDYHEEIADITNTNIVDAPHELPQMINDDSNYHILFGILKDSVLTIFSDELRYNKYSDELIKLQKELGDDVKIQIEYRYGVNLDKTDIIEIPSSEFKKDIKQKTMFHGTCLKFLPKIGSLGLKPTNVTNYGKIKHDNKIFLTANIEKAEGHAMNASIVNNSFPVVIEVKIPDVDKLIYDYDLAVEFEGGEDNVSTKLGYTKVFKKEGGKNKKGNKSWKETKKRDNLHFKLGAFAYLGRIPASYIESIWFDTVTYQNYLIAFEMGDIEVDFNSPMWNDMNEVTLWAEYDNYSEFKRKMDQMYDEVSEEEFDFDE